MIAAYEKGEPWLGYYWEPTWLLGKVGAMTRLEEPPYDKEIWDTTRACAYPSGAVDIVVHASLLDRAPEVVELLRNYETTTAMNNKVLAYMQESEADASEAAIWFLQEYESVWTEWMSPEVGTKVKAALP
jgi:ABC-type proline/glycine betaine transport system substrate-binding protein